MASLDGLTLDCSLFFVVDPFSFRSSSFNPYFIPRFPCFRAVDLYSSLTLFSRTNMMDSTVCS